MRQPPIAPRFAAAAGRVRRALPLVLATVTASAMNAQSIVGDKVARGRSAVLSSGSVHAAAAGRSMFEIGGNAVDGAAAAALALMVTDPANASLGGRVQLVVRSADGRLAAIDGATMVPHVVAPRADTTRNRQGFATVPVPGAVAAIARLLREHGTLTLAQVAAPAIQLAEEGFAVPARLAASWRAVAPVLRRDPGASRHFLKPDGAPYAAGERFRQPALARLLRLMADSGPDVFYQGEVAATLAREVQSGGGFVTRADLAAYRADDGILVRTPYHQRLVVSAGGRGWGNTLAQMLNIASEFPAGAATLSVHDVEVTARIVAQAMDDRPQELGSLRPKPGGTPVEVLSSPDFAQRRARDIRARMASGELPAGDGEPGVHDTSHLSAIDADGNAVALTTSLGPSFGSRVASVAHGVLFAHSYRMRGEPTTDERDQTEMTPTIVLRDGVPELVLGAAGSERIPTAVFQVVRAVVNRGEDLERAMAAPRLFARGRQVKLHDWFDPAIGAALRARGFDVEWVPSATSQHLGLVHAVWRDVRTGVLVGVADAGDSGGAAGR